MMTGSIPPAPIPTPEMLEKWAEESAPAAPPAPHSSAVTLPYGIRLRGFAATALVIGLVIVAGTEGVRAVTGGSSASGSAAVVQKLDELTRQVTSLETKLSEHTGSDGHAGVPKALGALGAQVKTSTAAMAALTLRIDALIQARGNRGSP